MNLIDVTAGNANINDKTKRMFSNSTDVNDEFILTSSNLKIWDMPEIRRVRSVGGNTLIWGNPIFGIWGSFNWGNSANTSFILGNSLAGVLGTSVLGSSASAYSTVDIINPNNTWRWLLSSLENTYWVSGSSDATISAGTSITFSSGSSLITERLSMESTNIVAATLSLEQDNNTNQSNLTFSLSADDGNNYDSVSIDTEHTFSTPGKYLRLKIVHTSGTTQSIISVKDTQGIKTPISINYR